MSQKPDGGSAFPIEIADWNMRSSGMSLRDYFAAVALQGLVEGDYFDGPIPEQGRVTAFAERAYQIADAMLKEREK